MIDPDARFGSKADKPLVLAARIRITSRPRGAVSGRFTPESGHSRARLEYVLCAGSGHTDASFDYPVVAAALPRFRMASASIRQTQLPEIVDHTVESWCREDHRLLKLGASQGRIVAH